MSPFQIEIMLHYFCCADDFSERMKREGRNPPILLTEILGLQNRGLLIRRATPNEYGQTYDITDRGRAYVEALKRVPVPIARWCIPGMPELSVDAEKNSDGSDFVMSR